MDVIFEVIQILVEGFLHIVCTPKSQHQAYRTDNQCCNTKISSVKGLTYLELMREILESHGDQQHTPANKIGDGGGHRASNVGAKLLAGNGYK